MRRQGCDDDRLRIGPDDRAAGRKGIGGGTGRRGEDHSVGTVRRHFLPVDDEGEVNWVGNVRVHDHGLVERPIVCCCRIGTFHRHIERHAFFHREVAFGDLAGKVPRACGGKLG